MNIPEYICNEINAPMCIALDIKPSPYASKTVLFGKLEIHSPYSLILLLIGIIMALKMIAHTDNLYASIGRGEMKIILYLFILSNVFLIPILNFMPSILEMSQIVFSFLAAIQFTLLTTFYFAIFASGITIDRIYGILRLNSHIFLLGMTIFYSFIILVFNIFGIFLKNQFVYAVLLLVNSLTILFYFIFQIKKLNKIKSDIWSYGVLGIILVLYLFTILFSLVGSHFISVFSERSLDNMFMVILFNTIFIMMIHKYWLGICDFEVECLELEA